MTDVLTVTYEINDEKKIERDFYIKRKNKDGSFSDVKHTMDIEADTLYKLITDQTFHTGSLRLQGEWIYEKDSYGTSCKCSKCGFDDIGETNSWIYNYCPICGAEMKH